jgi:putrescine transport system ATP-binding protein
VRPEKVAIGTEAPMDRHNRVTGVVEDIAYLGNMSTYYVRIENGALIKSQVANDRRIANRSITYGDRVWLSWTDTAGIVLAS